MPPTAPPDVNAILMDMYQQLGGISAKLEDGARRHQEFRIALEKIDARTDKIYVRTDKIESRLDGELRPVIKTVNDMKEDVSSLLIFKGKVGAIIVVGSIIGAAAIEMLWSGLKFIAGYVMHTLGPFH